MTRSAPTHIWRADEVRVTATSLWVAGGGSSRAERMRCKGAAAQTANANSCADPGPPKAQRRPRARHYPPGTTRLATATMQVQAIDKSMRTTPTTPCPATWGTAAGVFPAQWRPARPPADPPTVEEEARRDEHGGAGQRRRPDNALPGAVRVRQQDQAQRDLQRPPPGSGSVQVWLDVCD